MSAAFSPTAMATMHVLDPTLLGGILRSATFRPCTPYIFKLRSTTPPSSKEAILHVPIECQVVEMRSYRNFSKAWSSSGVYSMSWTSDIGLSSIAAALDPFGKSGCPAATSPAKCSIRRMISRCFLYIQKCFLASMLFSSARKPASKSYGSVNFGPVTWMRPREKGGC